MAFVFDHLAAILAGTVLLGALLFLQLRQQHEAIATTQRHGAQIQMSDVVASLQRDVENLRTPQQAQVAFGATRFTLRRAVGADGETYTSQFAFPTLLDPALGDASPVALVVYTAEPTGDSVAVGAVTRPTYRLRRHVYTRGTGAVAVTGGAENVVDFDVTLLGRDGSQTWAGTSLTSMPARVRIAAVGAAQDTRTRHLPGQTRDAAPSVRHALMAEVTGTRASGGTTPVETGTPGLPELPGDPPPAPPPPPPPPGAPAPPAPPPTPPGPSAPAPAPPTFPPPPPGRSI